MRKICVVTGSRADYGILTWLIREVRDDAELELQLVATGMHLSPEFGPTFKAIESDGFRIDRKVEVLLSSDTPAGMTKAVGLGVLGFADVFSDLAPDAVVVLGDRFEILAATQAAFFAGIPVAHISGGEVTEGAVDDVIRHAISKMSRYHFCAAERYRERLIQLGEQPSTVFNVGDPGLDNIARLELMSRDALAQRIGFDLSGSFLLTTYHPVTAGRSDPTTGMRALLDALDAVPEQKILFTKPNADAGGRELSRLVDEYASTRKDRVFAFTSLGQLPYLSAMKHCAVVVGNSSSGIVEAPAMGKPTVNIGPRQHGRLKAASIIDCAEDARAIGAALTEALSPAFQLTASRAESLYGNCAATTQIVAKLKTLPLEKHFAKTFYDLP